MVQFHLCQVEDFRDNRKDPWLETIFMKQIYQNRILIVENNPGLKLQSGLHSNLTRCETRCLPCTESPSSFGYINTDTFVCEFIIFTTAQNIRAIIHLLFPKSKLGFHRFPNCESEKINFFFLRQVSIYALEITRCRQVSWTMLHLLTWRLGSAGSVWTIWKERFFNAGNIDCKSM